MTVSIDDIIAGGGLGQGASRAAIGWPPDTIADYLSLQWPDASRADLRQVAEMAVAGVESARQYRDPGAYGDFNPVDVPIRQDLGTREYLTIVEVGTRSPRSGRTERYIISLTTSGPPKESDISTEVLGFVTELSVKYGSDLVPVVRGPIVTEIYRGKLR